MGKLCMIYNSAPHYRKGIFELIDKEYDCVWAVGHLPGIKDLDLSQFHGKRVDLDNKPLPSHFYWQKGALRLAFRRDIDKYFLLGDSYCLSSWLVAIIVRLRGKRLAFWSHGWYGKERGFKKLVSRIFWKLPNVGFIYNNRSRELMIKAGMNPNRLVTIYNSLDYNSQISIRQELKSSSVYQEHFGNDNPTIIFIGRLTPVKRLDQIIRALEILNRRGEKYNLIFVGDGTERKKLAELTLKLELNNQVWFYGACYDETKNAELIYNADLCVAPGNIGLTSIHTAMFGTPAATHNDLKWQMPEYEVIIDGITGFFFNRDDIDSLAEGISQWFSTKKGKREEVRKACYDVIDRDWNPLNQIKIIKENL